MATCGEATPFISWNNCRYTLKKGVWLVNAAFYPLIEKNKSVLKLHVSLQQSYFVAFIFSAGWLELLSEKYM